MRKITNSLFAVLLGKWQTEGEVIPAEGEPGTSLKGTDTYELVLDGHFILHKADVIMGDERSETIELIALGEQDNSATMQYFNSKGESGRMKSTLSGDRYEIDGGPLKFRGQIDSDEGELAGTWYLKSPQGEWSDFIKLRLLRVRQ